MKGGFQGGVRGVVAMKTSSCLRWTFISFVTLVRVTELACFEGRWDRFRGYSPCQCETRS
jgi:hypothetical protein